MNSTSVQFLKIIHPNTTDLVRFAYKNNNKWNESNLAYLEDIHINDDNADVYISFNSFDGIGKQSSNVTALSGFYFDIDFKDFHNTQIIDLAELHSLHESIHVMLLELINNGAIAEPTLICSTGCGKALYYLFDKDEEHDYIEKALSYNFA